MRAAWQARRARRVGRARDGLSVLAYSRAMDARDLLPERIESERLVIRVARPGDGALFNAAIAASHAELAPWLGWVSPLPGVAESEQNCRRAHARFLLNEDLMVFFLRKDSEGVLVGGSGLHGADWRQRIFEMGYWGHSAHAGQGLVTEGVRALCDHALQVLQANRVFLTMDARNTRSWQLAERAGFRLEGVLAKERLDLQGRPRDTRVYARTRI